MQQGGACPYRQTIDQCLCGFEIGSFETLAEPTVDRREKRNRL